MSWQNDFENRKKCPCGDGFVITEFESDDWGRSRASSIIECKNCEMNFKIKSKWMTKADGESFEIFFLLPKEIKLPHIPARIFHHEPIPQSICANFPFDALKRCSNQIKTITNSKDLSDKSMLAFFKKYYNTQKIDVIKTEIEKAIFIYKNFDGNLENYNSSVQKAKKEIELLIKKHAIFI